MKTRMKRMLCGAFALLIGMQPTINVMAANEEQAVVQGDGYTIRSNMDGTKTLTFSADIEPTDYVSLAEEETETEGIMAMSLGDEMPEEETDAPKLETTIEGSGDDILVTMEYGSFSIAFTPEIHEINAEKEETAQLETHSDQKTASGELEKETVADPEGKKPEITEIEAQAETAAVPEDETEFPTEVITEKTAEAEPGTEAGIERETEPETRFGTEAEIGTETEPETEAGAGTVTEPGTEIGTGTGTETESETETGIETEPGTETETETETESETEPESETEAETETEIPDSSIRYQKLENGIKEELVLYGYRGGHRVDYQFRMEGLVPVQKDQKIELCDKEGTVQANISAPYLYDASGEKCYEVAVSLLENPDGSFTLSYVPSDAWLA
ncbi:MAG: hypothetical protein PHR92_14340 [Lachnospiraceae bacterium]|nr:hypothetical protein [Lachnospiraceae bacterium]